MLYMHYPLKLSFMKWTTIAYVMLVGECTLMQAKKCIVMLQIHAIRKIYSIAIVQCMLVYVLGELPM